MVQKGKGPQVEQPPPRVVRKAAEGEEQALEILIRSYYSPIQGYLERVVGDVTDAQDLTQEVFLRMARGLPGFEGRAKFTTWLFQIAKNLGIDFLRRREVERVSSYQASIEAAPAAAAEQGVEETELLWASIGALDVDLRSALVLRDVYGFSYKEIAEIVGATLATVKWRIYQAREHVHTTYDAAANDGAHTAGPTERRR